MVTAEGKAVVKTQQVKSTKAVYKYEAEGKEINEKDICYKIGNIILKNKPKFTQFIKTFVEVKDKAGIEFDRIVTGEYFAYCPDLLKRLSKKNTMITFPFSWGLGFAFHQAYIRAVSDKYLVMVLTAPNVEKINLLVRFSEALNNNTKEIKEDNELISNLIAEQQKAIAEMNT
jgi:hypothetical protein